MDAKITKQRLARMLSYDWIKIIAVAVGVIFFWVLVFTTTATRITPAQNFYVYNYKCNRVLSEKFHSHLNGALEKGVFSYEVLETNVSDLVTAGDEYTATILDARMATSEGDVMFVPDIPDPNYVDQETNESLYTYVQSFVATYSNVLYEWDGERGYLSKMEAFLNDCYNGDHKTGELNEEKVKQNFRARIERTKDKRFKKQAQIALGEQAEIERIEKYKRAFDEFNAYLGSGIVALQRVSVSAGEEVNVDGNYVLNLCPNENEMPYLKDYVSYVGEKENEDGSKAKVTTAKDMCVAIYKFRDVEESFEFEAILYLNDLIKTCMKKA